VFIPLLQCRNGDGVCPDTMVAGGGGINNAFNVTGRVSNGLTCVQYYRLLNTGESLCVCVVCACMSCAEFKIRKKKYLAMDRWPNTSVSIWPFRKVLGHPQV